MDYTANDVGSNDQMFTDTIQDCVLHQHITEPIHDTDKELTLILLIWY